MGPQSTTKLCGLRVHREQRDWRNKTEDAQLSSKSFSAMTTVANAFILQEGTVFAERRAAMETWELLDRLEDRIELRWIMNGTESGSFVLSFGV